MRLSGGRFALVLAGLAAHAFAWGSDEISAVTSAEELNPSTFQQFISSAEVTMVDYYAPWCSHCQRFAPKFDTAARRIAEAKLDAKLGKVDCTIHQALCTKKGIRSYPTMKIYKQGEELYHEYTGPRRVAAIVEFVEKQILPVVTQISSNQGLDLFLAREKSEIVLVGYIDENDHASRKEFSAAAEKLHEDFPIGLVSNLGVAKYKGVGKSPAIVLYEPWDEGNVVYDGAFEVEAIKTFAKTAYTPLVGELNGDTFNMYTASVPTGFLFTKSDEEVKEWTAKLKRVAKTHKLRIATAAADEYAPFADFLAVANNALPSFAIFDPRTKQKFVLDETASSLSVHQISGFAGDFVAGKLSPTIRSLPVPLTQEGPVTVVVAKTFGQIVMDSSKDVLINFFREDCPFCRALAPTWDKLGEMHKQQSLADKLVVAAVDAQRNELDEKPMYVPSIMLYKAGDKSNPILYSGNRTMQDLIQFVKDYSTHGLDIDAAPVIDEPAAASQPILHGQSPMRYSHDEL